MVIRRLCDVFLIIDDTLIIDRGSHEVMTTEGQLVASLVKMALLRITVEELLAAEMMVSTAVLLAPNSIVPLALTVD